MGLREVRKSNCVEVGVILLLVMETQIVVSMLASFLELVILTNIKFVINFLSVGGVFGF